MGFNLRIRIVKNPVRITSGWFMRDVFLKCHIIAVPIEVFSVLP